MDQQLLRVLPESARSCPEAGFWPLHDATGSRRIEAAAASTLPSHTLMQRAGAAVARLAQAVAPHAQRIWIAAGPGNNGGDALEAARILHSAGRLVTVTLHGDAQRLPPDAATSLQRARAAGVSISPPQPVPEPMPQDLAIDGLLGLGLSRAPSGALADAVRALNHCNAPVLAIDLPSGLGSDNGQPLDAEVCVRATWTLSVLTLKPGLLTGSGRDYAGQVWFDALGVAAHGVAATACLSHSSALRALLPPRRHTQHKGSFGDLWVIGGASSMSGAALLAARAALYAGAGRVYLHMLDRMSPGVDLVQPELMWREATPAADALGASTVVCGCGGGAAIAPELPSLLSRAARLLLDADALNAVAADAQLQHRLAARRAHGLQTILTPHPLEAARLLQQSSAQVQGDRLGAAQALADRYQCVVVLKGSGSIVASPADRPWINGSGNAALATPGTGDVLAGWIGGLWAQGLGADDAARLGTHQHGAAADAWLQELPAARVMPASALLQRLART